MADTKVTADVELSSPVILAGGYRFAQFGKWTLKIHLATGRSFYLDNGGNWTEINGHVPAERLNP